jgi:hypothetical protein
MHNVRRRKSQLMLLTWMSLLIFWSMVTPSNAMGKFPWDAYQEGPVVTTCPPLKSYPKGVEAKLGKELRELRKKDPNAVTPGMVRDYGTLREQCRVISSPTGVQ